MIETAEEFGCPGEEVTVTIDTNNGLLTRYTKLYCVNILTICEERVVIEPFGVESISDVRSNVQLDGLKGKFTRGSFSLGQNFPETKGQNSHTDRTGVHWVASNNLQIFYNFVVCRSMFG